MNFLLSRMAIPENSCQFRDGKIKGAFFFLSGIPRIKKKIIDFVPLNLLLARYVSMLSKDVFLAQHQAASIHDIVAL